MGARNYRGEGHSHRPLDSISEQGMNRGVRDGWGTLTAESYSSENSMEAICLRISRTNMKQSTEFTLA